LNQKIVKNVLENQEEEEVKAKKSKDEDLKTGLTQLAQRSLIISICVLQ
jgi:hypothetical protein